MLSWSCAFTSVELLTSFGLLPLEEILPSPLFLSAHPQFDFNIFFPSHDGRAGISDSSALDLDCKRHGNNSDWGHLWRRIEIKERIQSGPYGAT